LCPYGFKNEKAMGPYWSPMASYPVNEIGFMGDLYQNKNKSNKS
jgi:hypothetical protein